MTATALIHLIIRSFRRATVAALVLLLAAVGNTQGQTRYTYSVAGDEVTDALTGLIWRRCSEGQVWSGGTCSGIAAAYTHEEALARAQTQSGTAGWRLPNVNELASITDKSRINPVIDTTAFPGSIFGGYWSSTPYAGDPGYVWVVDFYDGDVNYGLRTVKVQARLVR